MSTSTGTTSSASVYTTPAFWAPESLKRHREARQRSATVHQRYREFLALWRTPDPDRPEVAIAEEFLAKVPAASEIQPGRTSALTNFPNQLRWS